VPGDAICLRLGDGAAGALAEKARNQNRARERQRDRELREETDERCGHAIDPEILIEAGPARLSGIRPRRDPCEAR
jgi:hypothetical protein